MLLSNYFSRFIYNRYIKRENKQPLFSLSFFWSCFRVFVCSGCDPFLPHGSRGPAWSPHWVCLLSHCPFPLDSWTRNVLSKMLRIDPSFCSSKYIQ